MADRLREPGRPVHPTQAPDACPPVTAPTTPRRAGRALVHASVGPAHEHRVARLHGGVGRHHFDGAAVATKGYKTERLERHGMVILVLPDVNDPARHHLVIRAVEGSVAAVRVFYGVPEPAAGDRLETFQPDGGHARPHPPNETSGTTEPTLVRSFSSKRFPRSGLRPESVTVPPVVYRELKACSRGASPSRRRARRPSIDRCRPG